MAPLRSKTLNCFYTLIPYMLTRPQKLLIFAIVKHDVICSHLVICKLPIFDCLLSVPTVYLVFYSLSWIFLSSSSFFIFGDFVVVVCLFVLYGFVCLFLSFCCC